MACTTLVTAEVLAAHLDDPKWAVFDCRHDLARPEAGEQDYRRSHVPGAFFLHLDRDLSGAKTGRNGRHPLPDAATLARKLSAAGVGPGMQVVGYDAQGAMCSARLWWLLRWLGHDSVAVLDGGWPLWQAQGRPVSSDVPAARTGGLVPKPNPDALLSAAQLAGRALIDARAPDRFRGENETLDPVGGRIPGARNRFFRDNLDADGRFKEPALLRRELEQVLSGSSPRDTVHYCGSGVTACQNLLAMEIAGLAGGRLYPGSWSEWCSDPERPVARG